jgi:hypothetical protein
MRFWKQLKVSLLPCKRCGAAQALLWQSVAFDERCADNVPIW